MLTEHDHAKAFKRKPVNLRPRHPNPDLPAGPDNLPVPFHVYGMRQAIEEEFILDVLKNYTSYSLAFKLASEGREFVLRWSPRQLSQIENTD